MRKKQKPFQLKAFRLEQSLNDRLVKYCENTGASQAFVLHEALRSYLTVKGY